MGAKALTARRQRRSVERVADMTVGQRIKLLREARGLTQEGLARVLEMSSSQVSRWERGRDDPGAESIRALCRVLAARYEDLLGPVAG